MIKLLSIDNLTISDVSRYPVWQFAKEDVLPKGANEAYVFPVKHWPVSHLTGRIVASKIKLKNGKDAWSIIYNLDSDNYELCKEFISISILVNSQWHAMSRYFDSDYLDNGPIKIAKIMNTDIDDVFPFEYDVRMFVNGSELCTKGKFYAKPEYILTEKQRLDLIINNIKI